MVSRAAERAGRNAPSIAIATPAGTSAASSGIRLRDRAQAVVVAYERP
ncbi:hypothetical protein [Nonomuraea sp. 10N515B]